MAEKMGVDLQDLLPRFICNDATADVLWSLRLRKKEGVVTVVEGITLVGPQ